MGFPLGLECQKVKLPTFLKGCLPTVFLLLERGEFSFNRSSAVISLKVLKPRKYNPSVKIEN